MNEAEVFLENMRRQERESGLNPRLMVYWTIDRCRELRVKQQQKRAA